MFDVENVRRGILRKGWVKMGVRIRVGQDNLFVLFEFIFLFVFKESFVCS